MKKIGIITLNGNVNYGNKLQHYAVQTVLGRYGFRVETIRCLYNTNSLMYNAKHFAKIILRKRYRTFLNFDKKINYYKHNIYYNENSIIDGKIGNVFDYYVVGSDQVWNASIKCFNSLFLLPFTSNEKKISFSASFGISNLADNCKELFKNELMKFKGISVREDRGKEIIKELTNRSDIEVLVDPTMLLSSEEWDKVSKKPSMLKNNKYILTYFLGELSSDKKTEIDKIAKANDCQIINLLDKNSPFYTCGPSEFLYLEKNAFLICTDSFHSCVFSILYNKPFVVFDREQANIESLNSRIDTLLSKFKLEDRKYNGKLNDNYLECDYSNCYKILEKERKKATTFLNRVLEIKENNENEE